MASPNPALHNLNRNLPKIILPQQHTILLMNPLHLLTNPLVLTLAIGIVLAVIAVANAYRIKAAPNHEAISAAASHSSRMKLWVFIPLILLVSLIAFVAYIADQMFGVVAFTFGYFTFCLLTALAFGAVCYVSFRKSAPVVVLLVFVILGANFVLPPPSERLLRSAMLKVTPGTDASAIRGIVKQQYEGSPYAMPHIKEDEAGGFDRVHVSLLSQAQRSSTSVIFLIENGKVSRSIFSAD